MSDILDQQIDGSELFRIKVEISEVLEVNADFSQSRIVYGFEDVLIPFVNFSSKAGKTFLEIGSGEYRSKLSDDPTIKEVIREHLLNRIEVDLKEVDP